MAKIKEAPKFSEYISEVLSMFERAVKDYEFNYAEVGRLDGLTQDLLHSLELDELCYQERAKVATKLSRCRQDRRKSKDAARNLEPLVNWLNTERGKQLSNLLKEVLGKTRSVERQMESRVYRPRILQGNEGEKDGKD